MHLRFTEQELATLVEMVSLAADVASWNRKPGSDDGVSAYDSLENKILEKAHNTGLSDAIEWDEEKQRFQVKPEAQDRSFFRECYEEFRNESFWEDLVLRLSDRDLARQIGLANWEKLSEEQRRERTADLEKRYWDEFSKNGIERVAVIYPPSEG
ncbi:hypothetical protein HNR46_000221 [Haloferula luteola]|uniref:Uncharacterized protein n=1 Tax=Haloferula luteola TaxID=595692 RepID=A0A840V7R8_9BACT|nr:hypothetical protein [Haloferula luteola]MBB5350000.1 hypothetical protein [Haloferula luteola]